MFKLEYKILEIIFDNFDFQIIRLENESIKIMKLNKISEALKSERINSISEEFNKKLNILEFISMNDQIKFNNFLIGCNYNNNINNKENKKKFDDEIIDLSKEEKIFYPKSQILNSKHTISILGKSQNENKNSENKIFNVIKQNIYNIFNNKKTLLLIVDSFDEDDNNYNKNYLKEICNKINESKIPIVLLTNNLNIFLNNNNENFDFFKIENEEFENKENIIFYISNIIILHLFLNIENFNENIEKLKLKIKNFFLDSNLNYFLITHLIHKNIINLSEKIVYFKKFNFEEILFYLSDIFRKIDKKNIQKTEIFEKFKNLIEHDFEKFINNSIEVDINSKIIDFDFNAIEKDSFEDCYLNKKNKKNNKNNLNFKQRLKEDKNFYQKYLKNHLILHKKEIVNINEFFKTIFKLKEKNIINFLNIRNKKSYNKINLIQKFFKNINQNQLKRFFLNHDENKIIKKIDCYEFINENLAYDYYFDYVLIDQINDEINNNFNNKNIFCKMSKKINSKKKH